MASHLTVTTSTAGVATTKGFGTGAEADSGSTDIFAALLGAAGQSTQTAAPASSEAGINLANAINMSLGFGGDGAEQSEDPEAIAAAIDAIIPVETPADTAADLTALIEGLADLKARLDAGEPLDPEALESLEAALTELAEALDIDLDTMPTFDELAALAAGILPDDASPAAQLTAALTPLAKALMDGSGTADADAADELSAQIKSIGDKLAALLQSLNNGDIDADKLAQLGLDADSAPDAELEAALARLLNPAPKVDAATTAPVLASPELTLTEPVLTGKANAMAHANAHAMDALEKSGPPDTMPPTAVANGHDEEKPDARPEERKAETRSTPPAAAIDKPIEPQAGMQSTQAARVDAVAAPRVVQAGYQTSQQQLNLPQLAFELVRQVNDGNTRFQIRLDPPELGKIDVKLDIDASGQVNARLTVEKAETLDLMQRDQRGLERALQQAGLDGAKTNLEFSLKQNPFSGGQQGQDGNGHPLFGEEAAAEDEDVPPTVNLYRASLSASGVNIIA
ncbi:flagellar hook-length control protein FliK [Devosia sp.]|uniref:flagellar hook-length control protein FliK n=1 Tax=Devosia sp. TaxID=1871048 RepID=UPI002FCAA5B7